MEKPSAEGDSLVGKSTN